MSDLRQPAAPREGIGGLVPGPWTAVLHTREARAVVGALGLAVPLLIAILVCALFLGGPEQKVFTLFLISLIAVIGIGTFTGNSGILSFGHVAFIAVGAYVSGILTVPEQMKSIAFSKLPEFLIHTQLGMLPSLFAALAMVALVALLVGVPLARLGGAAAVIATLGFLLIIHVIIGAADFTRGSKPFIGVPRDTTIWMAFIWAVVTLIAARLFRESAAGLQLRAAREDELAARSVGVDVPRRRFLAWVVSAILCGISGVLLGHFLGAFSPSKFYFDDTVALLAMLIIGGMSTVSGALGGAIIVTVVIEILRRLEGGFPLFGLEVPQAFGLTQIGLCVMILLVMYRRPAGLVGWLEWDEFRRRRRPPAAPALGPQGETSAQQLIVQAPADAALTTIEATKYFAGLCALDQVSLELRPGEIVGLIGPNGSGKTTLLNVVSGALSSTDGSVLIDGADATAWPAHRIAQYGVGRTFQNIRLFGAMSVRENVEVATLVHRARGSQHASRTLTDVILNAVGLSAQANRAANTLAYGAAVGMTGWVAPYDSPVMEGLEVAIAEFKKEGGINGNVDIEVITKDNRSDTAQNAIVTQELIEEGVNFLIVTCDSSMVHAVATMIMEAQIPAISSCSSSPTLPFTGGGFVFANAPADNVQATVSAVYARDQGYERAYLLQSPDIEYTLMPVYFGEVFEKLGGTIAGTGVYEIGNQDFSAEVTKIASLDPPPDVIYTSAFEPDFPAFLRQLRAAGITTQLIAADGIDSPTTFELGEVANGVIYTTAGVAQPGNQLEAFNEKYEAHFGKPSETNINALGYDLAKVLEAAIVSAGGSTDPIAIRDALVELENVQGATSLITYKGTNGTPQRAVALVRVMDGKREFIAQPEPDMSLVPEPRL